MCALSYADTADGMPVTVQGRYGSLPAYELVFHFIHCIQNVSGSVQSPETCFKHSFFREKKQYII
ncbi:hypothetical protein DXA36_18415 [Eisenbergiella sp. OF01-20]|nr:hypothetical protein DXA36_18415 [Eisenbergiella sp. OF01-20]